MITNLKKISLKGNRKKDFGIKRILKRVLMGHRMGYKKESRGTGLLKTNQPNQKT